MKRLLLGSAFAILGASAALANDLPIRSPNYEAATAYNWSGIYGGISGGYGWGDNEIHGLSFGPNTPTNLNLKGGFGGLQLGYNNHFAPHWLIGGEIDFSMGNVQFNTTVPSPPDSLKAEYKFDFFGTARTRFGYVQDRWLVYGTAGAIWLLDKIKSSYVLGGGGAVQFPDRTQYRVGWVFGGGVEYAVDDRWSWKLEYLYAPLGRTHNVGQLLNQSWDTSFSLVRAGLNYRFADGGAPASHMPVGAATRSNWSGSYIGVHGGYGRGKLDESFFQGDFIAASFKVDGWYGGFQGGYNWLFAPRALLGFEMDASFGSLKGNAVALPLIAPLVPMSAKIDDLGTARLRLGYLVTPDVLVYVTGGAAYAREKFSALLVDRKVDHLGWTVGGGAEWKFAPEWSLKAEYLYADLGIFNEGSGLLPSNSDLTLKTVRVGLNYSGPVIERLFTGR